MVTIVNIKPDTWDLLRGQILMFSTHTHTKQLCEVMKSLKGGCLFTLYAVVCCLIAKPCPTLCNPMDCSTPGFTILPSLLEFTQTHVHWVSDAIQPSHPLSSPSPLAFNLYQHQGLFQWVNSSHQVTKVLKRQFQHQSFQWTFRTDFL